MTISDLIKALQRLKVETGSIACLGCGHEHNCGIHGCAIIREAAEKLGDFNAVFDEDTVVRLAGQFLKVEPGRLRELAEADRDGRLVVLPCKVGDTVYILHRTFDGADVVGETELWWTDIPQLGKTVFLTREEAEKALEAMKDGGADK